ATRTTDETVGHQPLARLGDRGGNRAGTHRHDLVRGELPRASLIVELHRSGHRDALPRDRPAVTGARGGTEHAHLCGPVPQHEARGPHGPDAWVVPLPFDGHPPELSERSSDLAAQPHERQLARRSLGVGEELGRHPGPAAANVSGTQTRSRSRSSDAPSVNRWPLPASTTSSPRPASMRTISLAAT